jgi:uroporphyrinogen decarboxylase
MTRRERVLTTISHNEPDRVPLGFDANAGIQEKLFKHFGVGDRLALYDAMGIDGFSVFTDSYVYPDYVGPELPLLEDGTKANFYGMGCHEFGVVRHNPLAFARSVEDLDAYRWPSADWFSCDTVKQRCLEIKARNMVTVGGEGGCGITHALNLRGYELGLVDPLTEPELTRAYMERMGDFFVDWNERWLSAAEGEFDIYRCGDDMGNSLSMHCSPQVWREFYKPQLERIFAVAKRHGLRIWFHCCGCCRPVLEDLIEIGVDMWDPVPAYVSGNDHVELKREYGEALTFVGGVDLPNVLVGGTPADVEDEVRRCIDTLAPGGGFILAGSQVLTDDVPLENVLTMYETALKYGGY